MTARDLPEPALQRRQKIIFLDIDGVLLRSIDWLHPRNAEASRLRRSDDYEDRQRALDVVQFDPTAVELVNRLARQAGAKIVVSSFWRNAIGAHQTVRKLIAQGIDRDLFHEDACCSHAPSEKSKDVDVRDWLGRHRATPLAPQPDDSRPMTGQETGGYHAKLSAWHKDPRNYGIDWVVLDDEFGPKRLVLTNGHDGFSTSDYRVALRALGGEDPEFGVVRLPDGLWEEVLAAHEGDPVGAARWVEGVPVPNTWRPTWLLDWKTAKALNTLAGRRSPAEAEAKDEALKAFRERLMADRPEGVGKVALAEFRSKAVTESEPVSPCEPRPILPFRMPNPDHVKRIMLAVGEQALEVEEAWEQVRDRQQSRARLLRAAEEIRAGDDLMIEPDPTLWQLARWVFSVARPRPEIVDEVRNAAAEEGLAVLPGFVSHEDIERVGREIDLEIRQVLKAAARAPGDLEAQVTAGADSARRSGLRVGESVDERMLVLALMRAACRVVERHRGAVVAAM